MIRFSNQFKWYLQLANQNSSQIQFNLTALSHRIINHATFSQAYFLQTYSVLIPLSCKKLCNFVLASSNVQFPWTGFTISLWSCFDSTGLSGFAGITFEWNSWRTSDNAQDLRTNFSLEPVACALTSRHG
jgi:hypothetical protein